MPSKKDERMEKGYKDERRTILLFESFRVRAKFYHVPKGKSQILLLLLKNKKKSLLE